MQGFIRGILAIIGVVALVVVGGIIYATTFFNPNELKPYLVDAFHERTGMTLAIDGNIAWRFYPQFGASIESAKVYGPGQSLSDTPKVSIRHADASFRIIPLLSEKLVMDGLNVQGVRVSSNCDLQRHDVCFGWVNTLAGLLRDSVAQATEAHGGVSWPRLVFDMERVQVDDGELHYLDMAGSDVRRIDINQFSLTGTRVALARMFPVTMRFDVASGAGPMMNVKLAAKALLDPAQAHFELQNIETTASLQEGGNRFSWAADQAIADLKTQHYQSLHNVLTLISYPEWLDGHELPVTLNFDAILDLPADVLRLEQMHGTSRQLHFSGELEGAPSSPSFTYRGLFALAPGDLREWLKQSDLPLSMSDAAALRDVSLNAVVNGDLHHAQFDVMSGAVDSQPFTGQLALSRNNDPTRLDLHMPALTLDRYLPASTDEKAGAVPREIQSPPWAAWIATHRNMRFSTSAEIEKVVWRGQPWHDVSWTLTADPDRWRLDQLKASLAQGQWLLGGTIFVGRTPMTLYANTTFTGLPSQVVFNAPELTQGSVDGHAEVSAQLNDPVGTLNGPLWLTLQQDTQAGPHLLRPLCQINEQDVPTTPQQTTLERLNGRFTVRDGVIYSDALDMTLPGLALKGEGIFDLGRHRFDYRLNARAEVSVVAQPCGVSSAFAKQGAPLRCAGTSVEVVESWCTIDEARAAGALSDELRRKGGLNPTPSP